MTRIFTAMLFALAAATATAQPEPSISFTLNVTVLDPSGQPIPDCPIEAVTYYRPEFKLTHPDGIASFSLRRALDESHTVLIMNSGLGLWADVQEKDNAIARFHALRASYAFPDAVVVNVAQQGDHAVATIQALPAVHVQGRVSRPDGSHFETAVAIRGFRDYARVHGTDGHFQLEGVPQDHAVELWFAGEHTEIHSVVLPVTQTAADLDLGDVVISDSPRISAIQGTIQNVSEGFMFPSEAEDVYNRQIVTAGIMLVRTDGQIIHSIDIDEEGRIFVIAQMVNDYTDIAMSEGKFYIVPGQFPGTTPGLALLDSIRAGRHAQLDAAGVPKFTFVAGQTTVVEFDAQAAVNAVMAVGADLLR